MKRALLILFTLFASLAISWMAYDMFSIDEDSRLAVLTMFSKVEIGDSRERVFDIFNEYRTDDVKKSSYYEGRLERFSTPSHILLRDRILQVLYSSEGDVLATGIRTCDGITETAMPRNGPPDNGDMVRLLSEVTKHGMRGWNN